MAKIIILSIILLCLKATAISSLNIQQSPEHLLLKPEQNEAKLNCRHGDTNYPYMYWYQQKTVGGLVELIGMLHYEKFTPEEKFKARFNISGQSTGDAFLLISSITTEDSAVYFCAASILQGASGSQAYFGDGTKLTVLDPNMEIQAPNVTVLNVSEKEVCTKENVTLVCVAKGFYPDHVKVYWKVDEVNRTTDVSTDEAAIQGSDKYYTISSRLNIDYKTEWTRGKTFTCIVNFFNNMTDIDYQDSITGPKLTIDEDNYETYVRSVKTTMLAYGMFVAKSIAYGIFIMYIVRRQGFMSK